MKSYTHFQLSVKTDWYIWFSIIMICFHSVLWGMGIATENLLLLIVNPIVVFWYIFWLSKAFQWSSIHEGEDFTIIEVGGHK